MRLILGITMATTFAVATVGCKQVKEGLRAFVSEEEENEESASEAASTEGLSVTTSFLSLSPNEFHTAAARTDQLTVVEFYSDT